MQVKTLQHWRWRTRKGQRLWPKVGGYHPSHYVKFMTIRYNFDNVLAWEKENNIDPITLLIMEFEFALPLPVNFTVGDNNFENSKQKYPRRIKIFVPLDSIDNFAFICKQ